MSAGTAGRLGLEPVGTIEAVGASGPASLEMVTVPHLDLGGLVVRNLYAVVVEDATLTPFGGRMDGYRAFDGVLGADVLRRFDVLISAPTGRLVLFAPGSGPGAGADLQVDAIGLSRRNGPLVRHVVGINGVRITAILDSGSRRLVLNGPAARRAGVDPLPDSEERGSPGVGTQETLQRRATLDRLSIGSVELRDLPVHVADLPVFAAVGLGSVPTVLLGAPALATCPVFISYSSDSIRYCDRLTLPSTAR